MVMGHILQKVLAPIWYMTYFVFCTSGNTDTEITTAPVFDDDKSKNISAVSSPELIKIILSKHDRRIPPHFATETHDPTIVYLQLHVYGIYTFNEAEMDYSVALFLQQKWKDVRLQWQHPLHGSSLEMDSSFMDLVWVPDLFFSNEKEGNYHKITVQNRMMHLERSGTILYSIRLSLKLSCDMDLRNYPFDWQTCGIVMESYGHTTKTIIFRWFEELPLDMNRTLNLPQFFLMGSELSDCTKLYGGTLNYTCLRVDFHLKRKAGYFIVQLYIPSIMIVILSWVSFWLNVDAIPARISLGILTILAMTTQTSGESRASPKVSYVRAIDVWMFSCMVFVFSSLLEFALVNVFARKLQKLPSQNTSGSSICSDIHLIENPQHRKRRPTSSYALGDGAPGLINLPDPPPNFAADTFDFRETTLNLLPKPDLENGLLNNGRQGSKKRARSKRGSVKRLAIQKASIFDRISRIFFPFAFIVFNTIYWPTYIINYQFNEKAGVWPD